MDLLAWNISFILQSIDNLLKIWLGPLQKLFLHQRMHFPESFAPNDDTLETNKFLTNFLFGRDPIQSIMHIFLTNLSID